MADNRHEMAKHILQEAHDGKTNNIGKELNGLSLDDQKAVFKEMQNIQGSSSESLPDLHLVSDGSGRLGEIDKDKSWYDATRIFGSKTDQVWASPEMSMKNFQKAQDELTHAVGRHPFTGVIGNGSAQEAGNAYENNRAQQTAVLNSEQQHHR